MPVVLLVRHGQASFGAADYDQLSDLGRRQAALVGDELRRRGLRDPAVVTGSLRRQRDTAAIALPGSAVRPDPRWDEYDSLDLLKRHAPAAERPVPASSREVQRLLDAALLRWIERGGAPDRTGGWPQFRGGALAALSDLVHELGRGRDGVVFTSGGVIAAVAADLLDAGGRTVVALNRVAVNTAVTKIIAGSQGLSMSAFNEHAHLPAADVTYR